ncbi:MAG: flagellar hook-length control protein FliK [Burkholderiaceae bacterium]
MIPLQVSAPAAPAPTSAAGGASASAAPSVNSAGKASDANTASNANSTGFAGTLAASQAPQPAGAAAVPAQAEQDDQEHAPATQGADANADADADAALAALLAAGTAAPTLPAAAGTAAAGKPAGSGPASSSASGAADDEAAPAIAPAIALADPQNAYALAALGLLPPLHMPAAAPVSAPAAPRALDLSQLQLQALPTGNGGRAPSGASAGDPPLPQLDQGAQALLDRLGQSLVKPATGADRSGAEHGDAPAADDGAADALLALAGQPLGDDGGNAAAGGLQALSPALSSRSLAAPAELPAAAPLQLRGEPGQWQQPLLQALGDRLQLQIAARSEQATIKLSPPMLGQVEIAIRQQGGELQVRLSASHGDVARQLQAGSETLRQDLVQRHSGEVSVQVSASSRDVDTRGGQGGRGDGFGGGQSNGQSAPDQQRRPGRALSEAEPEPSTSTSTSFAASLNTKEQVLQ